MTDRAEDLDASVAALSAAMTGSRRPAADRRQILRLVDSVARLVTGGASSLDVKIASAAVAEMNEAFTMFAPWRDTRKVTMFGSARIGRDDSVYALTVDLARAVADAGFMVVTGAGPGLMEAGMVGAGRERSIGVSIRLPFEASTNPVIAGDDKHVSMRYFFTRKLMLMKESHGFVCLPGGFGTLDETFELLTLLQTGRAVPAPIVFLEPPGRPFWAPIMAGLMPTLLAHGVISESDVGLYRITDDVPTAVGIISGFYSNYHSIRHVDDLLVIRTERAVPGEGIDGLRRGFAHLHDGRFATSDPTGPEKRDNDCLDKARIVVGYTGKGYSPLISLIEALNAW